MDTVKILEALATAKAGLFPEFAPLLAKRDDDKDKQKGKVFPKAPKKKEDVPKAKSDLKKLKEETYELKLEAKSLLEVAIAGAWAKYKTGTGSIADVVDLKLKLIDLNEKIIAELEEMIEDAEGKGKGKGGKKKKKLY